MKRIKNALRLCSDLKNAKYCVPAKELVKLLQPERTENGKQYNIKNISAFVHDPSNQTIPEIINIKGKGYFLIENFQKLDFEEQKNIIENIDIQITNKKKEMAMLFNAKNEMMRVSQVAKIEVIKKVAEQGE